MSQSVVELILLVLLVFFVGCILGYLLHLAVAPGRKGPSPSVGDGSDGDDQPEAGKMAERKVPTTGTKKTLSSNKTAEASRHGVGSKTAAKPANNGTQPKGLPAPRGGSPDPLQRISGVGPKIETRLHELGIFHFDQIAAWSEVQEQWVDSYLKFKGRIGRDEWVNQAKLLAQGKQDEFASRYPAEKKGSKTRNSRVPNG